MKLNDPFGRMERRHQQGYESMRSMLRERGVDAPEAARELITRTRKQALRYMVIGVAVLLAVTVVIPKAMPLTLSLGLFLVVWVATSTINGQRYIQRYIDEELGAKQAKTPPNAP